MAIQGHPRSLISVPLVINNNMGPNLHCFGESAIFWSVADIPDKSDKSDKLVTCYQWHFRYKN